MRRHEVVVCASERARRARGDELERRALRDAGALRKNEPPGLASEHLSTHPLQRRSRGQNGFFLFKSGVINPADQHPREEPCPRAGTVQSAPLGGALDSFEHLRVT